MDRRDAMSDMNMNYQSPITLLVSHFKEGMGWHFTEAVEDYIMQVVQSVGVTVDKEELFHALAYDRHQYDRGYEDGSRLLQQAVDDLYKATRWKQGAFCDLRKSRSCHGGDCPDCAWWKWNGLTPTPLKYREDDDDE